MPVVVSRSLHPGPGGQDGQGVGSLLWDDPVAEQTDLPAVGQARDLSHPPLREAHHPLCESRAETTTSCSAAGL